ncbi:MAG TPA: hypothetical protein VF282_00625 [Bacillota bacterium]
MVRLAWGAVTGAAVLAALALGVTTRSLGLDLIALRQANDQLVRTLAQRDEALAALEAEAQRLRSLVDGLQTHQAPDVVSMTTTPSPGPDGMVETDRIEVHVAANGPATHVLLLFHPDPGEDAPAGAMAPAPGGVPQATRTPAVEPDPGRPAGGVPPSPTYVVDVRRGGREGWVLQWDVPPGAAGTLYVEACNGTRCTLAAQPAAVIRGRADDGESGGEDAGADASQADPGATG